jgi:hypothetical protein
MTPERTPPRLTLAELEQWYRRERPQGWWSTAWNTVMAPLRAGSRVGSEWNQGPSTGVIVYAAVIALITVVGIVLILTGHGKIVIDMLDSQPKLPILINSN